MGALDTVQHALLPQCVHADSIALSEVTMRVGDGDDDAKLLHCGNDEVHIGIRREDDLFPRPQKHLAILFAAVDESAFHKIVPLHFVAHVRVSLRLERARRPV